jgi:UDP-N-acetylmuramoyl-tripeptide--D-alanyl-D-alanine ligase
MLSFVYLYLAWSLVLLKRLLAYLYLWQKKEYRIDKIVDYLNTPESKSFLWDPFSKLYYGTFSVFVIIYLAYTYNVLDRVFLLVLAFAAILLVQTIFWVDAVYSIYKLLKNKLLVPKFTTKLSLIFALSIVFLGGLMYYTSLQPFALSTTYQMLVIFSIPLVILFASILIKPIEQYQKQQIIKQAAQKRDTLPNLKVIAISGSYGKTTTKDILYQILGKKYRVVKSQKNQNTTLSIARQLIALDPKTEIFIAEIGAYKKGDGIDTCSFLKPTTSVITGLNNQHFSLFGSEKNIIIAESESLTFLPPGAHAYINFSSPLCHQITIPKGVTLIKYGIDNTFDVYGKNIAVKKNKSYFDLYHNKIPAPLHTNLLSNGNIENLVGAIAVSRDLGVYTKQIQEIIADLPDTPATLQSIQKPWGTLIDDSYNANINGVVNALSLLDNPDRNKILILDDILELGEQSIETHKNLAYVLLKLDLDLIVLVGRNYGQTITEVFQAEHYKGKYITYDMQSKETLGAIHKHLKKPTNILLEGYRSKLFLDKL